jgi:hypothetical protein
LHIQARAPLPPDLGIPNTLTTRTAGNSATATVVQWQPARAEELAKRLDASVEVEALGLEDIFLELHR